ADADVALVVEGGDGKGDEAALPEVPEATGRGLPGLDGAEERRLAPRPLEPGGQPPANVLAGLVPGHHFGDGTAYHPAMRLLVVDDEPEICMLVQTMARVQGLECLTANNAADARALCRDEELDVLLLDV